MSEGLWTLVIEDNDGDDVWEQHFESYDELESWWHGFNPVGKYDKRGVPLIASMRTVKVFDPDDVFYLELDLPEEVTLTFRSLIYKLVEGIADSGIPGHMHNSVLAYVVFGQPVGDFLSHIFRNDFLTAAAHADAQNKESLFNYAYLLHNYVPGGAIGSEEYESWVKQGGWYGVFRGPKEPQMDEV